MLGDVKEVWKHILKHPISLPLAHTRILTYPLCYKQSIVEKKVKPRCFL